MSLWGSRIIIQGDSWHCTEIYYYYYLYKYIGEENIQAGEKLSGHLFHTNVNISVEKTFIWTENNTMLLVRLWFK